MYTQGPKKSSFEINFKMTTTHIIGSTSWPKKRTFNTTYLGLLWIEHGHQKYGDYYHQPRPSASCWKVFLESGFWMFEKLWAHKSILQTNYTKSIVLVEEIQKPFKGKPKKLDELCQFSAEIWKKKCYHFLSGMEFE